MYKLADNQCLRIKPTERGTLFILETYFYNGPFEVGVYVTKELNPVSIELQLDTLYNIYKTSSMALSYKMGAEKLAQKLSTIH